MILVVTGSTWGVTGSNGAYWPILVYTDPYLFILVYIGDMGMFWSILVYTGSYRFILAHICLY